mmetsp:Transcript_27423/g.78791  ORF Transcript_27423/g.78791 Transcript_27423/m.78791 type:complete len:468 (+) Transcript_27423:88-1491(+)
MDQMEGQCAVTSEADAQRFCGDLYITHGLESACGTVLFLFFGVVAVKLHARSHLKHPAKAFLRFVWNGSYELLEEFFTTLSTIHLMPQMDLEVRLRFCGNIDKMTNLASAWLSLLGITRWLSIGNVNGMRYIGYGMTCPLTQVELVVLLAPFVPCYKFVALFSFLTTFMTLMAGYAASLMWMPLWEGDLLTFLETKNIDDLAPTQKLKVVSPAFCGISVLALLVIPSLGFIYKINGGAKNPDLPSGYICLLMLVWFTWNCFPVWWMMSWEGMAVIQDTKFNEIGFTMLNIFAKGSFTLQGFRMGAFEEKKRLSQVAVTKSKGKKGKKGHGEYDESYDEEAGGRKGKDVGDRREEFDSEKSHVPPIISRKSSRKLSKSMFVTILRDFDTQPRQNYLGSVPENVHKEKGKGKKHKDGARDRRGSRDDSGSGLPPVPTDECPDVHNPWFRSCLQHSFRPVVGHRQSRLIK